jgi:hypothetical protein
VSTTTDKVWNVVVEIHERGDDTEARAIMDIEGTTVGGWGRARRSPDDPGAPHIGEELATARALGDLAHRILEVSAMQVERHTAHDLRPHH